MDLSHNSKEIYIFFGELNYPVQVKRLRVVGH